MNIAIVGGGVSGIVAAHALHGSHRLTLFEANDYLGGHTNTISVERDDGPPLAVDTARAQRSDIGKKYEIRIRGRERR